MCGGASHRAMSQDDPESDSGEELINRPPLQHASGVGSETLHVAIGKQIRSATAGEDWASQPSSSLRPPWEDMQARHEAKLRAARSTVLAASTMDTGVASQSSTPCRVVLGPRVPGHDGEEEMQHPSRSIAERPNLPPGPVMDLPPMGDKGQYATSTGSSIGGASAPSSIMMTRLGPIRRPSPRGIQVRIRRRSLRHIASLRCSVLMIQMTLEM